MRQRLAFVGFSEGTLNFPPSYRYQLGCRMYTNTKKQRVMSWTDRILWCVRARVRKLVEGCVDDVGVMLWDSIVSWPSRKGMDGEGGEGVAAWVLG